MRPTKACPVVLRDAELLVFEHPRAGMQLVKGTIAPGETAAEAAVRELFEEAGIAGRAVADLGTWVADALAQVWWFQRCDVDAALPGQWTHDCADDGGHRFRFFWHPLAEDLPASAHAVYRAALAHLRKLVA
jgi:8-oxo-dGTP pyrophosphatase MutT (NUDIX family)